MTVPVKRFIVIVLDSVGVGALPDAAQYGDEGANTLGNIMKARGPDLALPHLAQLGLFQLPALSGAPSTPASGAYGTMACQSPAKDTTAGHWELAGIVLPNPFPLFPHGFPRELVAAFEQRIGTKTLGNVPASGTEIIKQLGEEHCRTGYPIIYTSADSVFQIAAHEERFGLDRLYDICRIAREMLHGEWGVSRVIARPFTGVPEKFTRTANRRDFSLQPPGQTLLDRIKDSGGNVIAIGKIKDIFAGQGITRSIHTSGNAEGMFATCNAVSQAAGCRTLVFTNLVDFDMLWGHRRDVVAYARGLKEFDQYLPSLLERLQEDDVLIITADHGCDPTCTRHTDHTREYVPLLVYGKRIKPGVNLGVRSTFADVAQTIADMFGLAPMAHGTSFRKSLEW